MRWGLLIILAVGCADPESAPPVGAYDTPVDDESLAGVEIKADDPYCDGAGGPQDGADLLVLVNKELGLQASYAPKDAIELDPPSKGSLRYGAVVALEALQDAALTEAGIEFRVRSGYRSYRTQCRTFRYWVDQKGLEHALRYSAQPGKSQHQLGTTVDLTCDAWNGEIEPWVAETPEAAWLFGNAPRFGFALSYPEGAEDVTGYAFEPWHYRFIGVDAAAEMVAQDLILEDYLRKCADPASDLACPQAEMPPRPLLSGFIGSPCADASECARLGAEAVCLTDGHPLGHCTVKCERSCPDAQGAPTTFCAATREGNGYCRSKCDFEFFAETGCRSGYACLDGQRPNQGATADVCLPDLAPESD